MKIFHLLSLLLFIKASISTDIQHITFKSKSCETLAFDYATKIFPQNTNIVALRNIGILSIEIDLYDLENNIKNIGELHACIKSISPNRIIKLDAITHEKSSVEDEREQWHLKRINVRNLPLPSTYSRFEVKDVPSHVYIIDSGIDQHHPDFKGRLAPTDQHKTFTKDYCECQIDGPLCDCNGHGTHCAGLVASPQAGYNLQTTLHSSKVFSSSGSTTSAVILQAMDWTLEAYKTFHPNELTIVSMSLGGTYSEAEDDAVAKLHDAGMLVVVSAGNSNADACTQSPAAASKALTVGASDIDDSRATFSNYGKCVDIFAPGVKIWSCQPGGGYVFKSGTSMSTPFLVGFSAYVGTYLKTTDPHVIKEAINKAATIGIISNSKTENNNLPYDNLNEILESIADKLKFLA